MSPYHSCPAAPEINQTKQDASAMLQSMGGTQECKTAAMSALSENSTALSVYAKGSVPFASVEAGMNLSTGSSDTKTSGSSSGCSDVFSQLNQQLIAKQNITCQLSDQESNKIIGTSAGNAVTLKQMPKTPERIAADAAMLASIPKPVMPQYPNSPDMEPIFNRLVEAYQQTYHEYMEFARSLQGDITFDDVTITMTAGSDVQQTGSIDMKTMTDLKSNMKSAVTAAATAQVQKTTEMGATVTPGMKQAVEAYVNEHDQDITGMIQNSVDKLKMTQDANNEFTLQFYGSLHFSHTHFDGHIEQRLIADNMMKSARTLGKTMASDIVTDITTKSDAEIKQKGLEGLQKVIQQGRADQMKAAGEASANMIKAGGGGMMGLLIAFMMLKGGVSKILIFIVLGIIAYLVLALLMGFPPFSKKENRRNHSGPAVNNSNLEMNMHKPEKKKVSGYHSNMKYIS